MKPKSPDISAKLDELTELIRQFGTDNAETRKSVSELSEQIKSVADTVNQLAAQQEESDTRQHSQSVRLDAQQEQINMLTAKVDELTRSGAVVWRDRRRVALDRETAYSAFDKLDFSPCEAMRVLDGLKIIDRDKSHFCRLVRLPGGYGQVKRALVIYPAKLKSIERNDKNKK